MKILLIQTGGSIDKDYPSGDDDHGYSFEITAPAYERILSRIKPSFDYETESILKKDSLDITDEDRQLILDRCKASNIDRIVITHGTDTMVKTAEVLSQLEDKTIVLTGAFAPELFKNTDADFNLGMAIAGVTILAPGVYITMDGIIMPWSEIEFSKTAGRFVAKSS